MTGLIPNDAVAIGIGACLGALSRYHAGRLAAEWIATDPNKLGKFHGWHTTAINVGGSFILGSVAGAPTTKSGGSILSARKPLPQKVGGIPPSPPMMFRGFSPRTKLMLGVGFCGSFTTFSTFSVDVVTWLSKGETTKAVSYVAANNVGGFVAAAAGLILMKKLFG